MSLRPRLVNFDETWANILETLQSIVTLKKIARAVWNDRFSDVYALCVAFPEPLGEKLYAGVKHFLENHVQSLYEAVSSSDVDILRLYHKHWLQFSKGSLYMNLLFGYLNTHLKKQKQDYGEISPYSTSFSPDSVEDIVDIGALALDIWKRKMIEPLKETLVEHVLIEVKKDRNGEDTHQNVIHDTVLSFVEVQQFQSKGSLHLYEEVLEKPLLKETKSYYRREAAELHSDNTCHGFIAKIDVRIQDEDLRTRKFFHPVSYSRVIRECEARMVEDYIPYLQGECRQMVNDENRADLARLYKLLKHIPRGLQAMVAELEEHITKTGLQSIKAVKVENGPQQYVDELLNIHRRFSDLIKETFRDDPAFISALDKACATIVNYKHDPRRSSRSPELLAKYCDSVLKKSTKNLSDSELDERLGDIIIIFKYIDDKDIFQKFYSKMLAKRLIHTLSVSMDAEEGMISRLKHACGYEYTNKLHRMFTDISISADLNSEFNDFLSNANASLGVGFSLFVLQSGAWPLGQTSISPLSIPQELVKSVQMFEQFYNGKFNGRKLTWLQHLSTGEVKVNFLKRPYIITVTTFQMSGEGVYGPTEHTEERLPRVRRRSQWEGPNEEFMKMLLDLGISKNAAEKALFMTDNSSVDAAASWVLDNQELPDLDEPFKSDSFPALEAHAFERSFPLDEMTIKSPYKMVFVVNTELQMGLGKIAAQVGHAAVGLYKILTSKPEKYDYMVSQWEDFGGTKIVLKGNNSAHLFDLEDLAQKAHIPYYLVHDAGKTQVAAGSLTVIGLFGSSSEVGTITGTLLLL